jgi:hypothetical protein
MDMFARMGEMLESEKLFITRINWAYVGPLIGTFSKAIKNVYSSKLTLAFALI